MDLSRLACKILERVRDFRSSFIWAEPKPKRKNAKPKKPAAKVYAKQPTKPSKKTKTTKTKSSRGRATVKK
jgi:hypothetical protein